MKRKRGNKKGKQKQPKKPYDVVLKPEESLVSDDGDNSQPESPIEIERSASLGSDEPAKTVQVSPDKPTGKGRVKVKLKSSKTLDPNRGYGDTQMQSDTDKSSLQLGSEKQGEGVVKMKDEARSLPEVQRFSRKAGSIKIKSSRGVGSLSAITNPKTIDLQGQDEGKTQTVWDKYKTADPTFKHYQREHKYSHRNPRYNQQELNAALMVIEKIMKMDAAEPFNVPVDPIALGIPDYFDIIKTPMDFGTICKTLEHGNKYMNSEDVYKDVQYIWENCYKYNNKGDYVVDLMKRVKKNFMKYWTSAGLNTDQSNRTNDATLDQDSDGKMEVRELGGRMTDGIMLKQQGVGTPSLNGSKSIHAETPTSFTRERLHVKHTLPKQKKRRGRGINKHKYDCLCAVCVVRRRRREREGNSQIVEGQIEISDGNMSQEFRQEETSENPGSDDASSNSDCSLDPDAEPEFEVQGMEVKLERCQQQDNPQQKNNADKLEIQKTAKNELSEHLQLGDRSEEELNPDSRSEEMEDADLMTQIGIPEDDTPLQQGQEATEVQRLLQKQQELQEREKQNKLCKTIHYEENPSIRKLCQTLFPMDNKSLWSGPHSLVRQDASVHRSNAIHSAIAMFMK